MKNLIYSVLIVLMSVTAVGCSTQEYKPLYQVKPDKKPIQRGN